MGEDPQPGMPPGFPPKKKSYKLDRPARQQVKRRLIAGDSGQQINEMLVRLGHEPLASNSISHYRKHPTVQRGLQQAELDAISSGLALRGKQVEAVKDLLQRTIDRMVGTINGRKLPDLGETVGGDTLPKEEMSAVVWAILGRETRDYIKLLQQLVTASPLLAQQEAEAAASAANQGIGQEQQIREGLVNSMIQGMFNDALMRILEQDEQEAAPESSGAVLMIEEAK